MLNFDFYCPTRILFGRDAGRGLVGALPAGTKRVLLHYGSERIRKNGLYDTLFEMLTAAGITVCPLGGVRPNPRLSLVREGVALCMREKIDLVLAVGGGSVIDSAKAIAIGACYPGDLWQDIYVRLNPITKALPVACVLTIPAAGSESSPNSVITHEENGMKLGYGSPLLRPVCSVVDPTFFFTLPADQIANGAADMLCHVFERYFSPTDHCDLTDELCEGTMRTILKNAPLLMQNPQDYDAWCQIGFAGTIAHNNILGVGRVQDWGCHGMEHPLSACYDIPHGAGLAVLVPHWMRTVAQRHPQRFFDFAVRVMGVCAEGDAMRVIEQGIELLEAFYRTLRLRARLSDFGIPESDLPRLAYKAVHRDENGEECPLGGIQKLHEADVLDIYRACGAAATA